MTLILLWESLPRLIGVSFLVTLEAMKDEDA